MCFTHPNCVFIMVNGQKYYGPSPSCQRSSRHNRPRRHPRHGHQDSTSIQTHQFFSSKEISYAPIVTRPPITTNERPPPSPMSSCTKLFKPSRRTTPQAPTTSTTNRFPGLANIAPLQKIQRLAVSHCDITDMGQVLLTTKPAGLRRVVSKSYRCMD